MSRANSWEISKHLTSQSFWGWRSWIFREILVIFPYVGPSTGVVGVIYSRFYRPQLSPIIGESVEIRAVFSHGLHGTCAGCQSPWHPILTWLGCQDRLPPCEVAAHIPGGFLCLLGLPKAREISVKPTVGRVVAEMCSVCGWDMLVKGSGWRKSALTHQGTYPSSLAQRIFLRYYSILVKWEGTS